MAKGDHIYVCRFGYTHHGIDCGDGTVIHYTGEVGRKINAAVSLSSMPEFMGNAKTVKTRLYDKCDNVMTTMHRATSRMREKSYNLIFNNCEHFATWCKTGKHQSEQVKDTASTVAGSAGSTAAVAGSLGVVSGVGAAAGLSGPGIMSGLATVGGVVGGGAVAGVATLGAAPAVVTTVAMRSVLRDDPALPKKERTARKAGRYATLGGGVAGTGATVGAIATAGTAGLSGAGITSGLAAIGSVVGGGMSAGVAVSVAAPAVAAAGIGYGVYKICRWLKS